MAALGAASVEERQAFERHLGECAACRAISVELRSTAGSLEAVTSVEAPTVGPVPVSLAEAVLGALIEGDRTARLRRRTRLLVSAGVAAALVALALIVAGSDGNEANQQKTVALHGAAPVHASAVLEARPWGTSLTFREQGLATEETYTVSMASSAGTWWTAGTYRSTNTRAVTATMACAVRLAAISEIRVTDAAGHTVLSGRTDAVQPW
jgi:predicted anti-sigma-YlaC factor YlaD